VGPIILICNLDVLENATLSVLSGEGPREGRLSNPLRQLVPFLFFLQSNKITIPIWKARVLISFWLEQVFKRDWLNSCLRFRNRVLVS